MTRKDLALCKDIVVEEIANTPSLKLKVEGTYSYTAQTEKIIEMMLQSPVVVKESKNKNQAKTGKVSHNEALIFCLYQNTVG